MRNIYSPTDTEPQLVITKDNVEPTANGAMWVRPAVDEEGIKRSFQNIDEWKRAAIQLAMTNLRQEFGELSLNESLMARETIATHLQRILDTFIIGWGLTVNQPPIYLAMGTGAISKAAEEAAHDHRLTRDG